MTFMEKVKALFAEEVITPEIEKVFVKTIDGKILSILGKELVKDAEIFLVNEDASESILEDGEYVLEDKSTLSVKDGKVADIIVEIENPEEEIISDDEETEVEMSESVLEDVIETPVEEILEETPVNEIDELKILIASLQEELELLKSSLMEKDKEVVMAREAFNKLKSEPATQELDIRKFEKTEITANKKDSMLSAVKNITSKK